MIETYTTSIILGALLGILLGFFQLFGFFIGKKK